MRSASSRQSVSSIRFVFLGAAGLLLAACHSGGHPDDPALLQRVLTDYFDAIGQHDTAKMQALTTNDFILYEDGLIWNNDSAFKNIRRHLPFTVKYTLGNMHSYVDEHSGDCVYTNRADFVFHDSDNVHIEFLETASFRKTAAGWKMNVLHVTEREPRYDTIRYLRDHYAQRLKVFAAEPLVMGRLVFLGNSITELGDWKKLTGDSTAVNRGIAADNSFGVLDRLGEVIARRPRKLFLEIGINDIAQDIPVGVIENNIYSIARLVRAGSPNTSVYVTSILPTNNDVRQEYPELYGKNGIVQRLNYELRLHAMENGFGYIDVWRRVVTADGDLHRRYARPDGLHLNEAGYRVWAELIRNLPH
ncbi:GDSL-type esterase/lipase family protein [Puia dinghuensis]|uniref:GDSL-type esterase/lipase family protein n=1 Tax=Puia dinghuensis TaxID=1792502 RepID=UPI00166D6766|nr:GDSL-type esterase/lipase family protein [Puia dinghuensis]